MYTYDISRTGNYLTMLSSLKHRQRAIAPFTVGHYCKPVTPLQNPKTKLSSHFIVRLIDSEASKYSVDCLVRDMDLYFVAFRRRLTLRADEDEQQHTKKNGKQCKASGWGTWYRLEDPKIQLPAFLNAQHSGVPAAYGQRFPAFPLLSVWT